MDCPPAILLIIVALNVALLGTARVGACDALDNEPLDGDTVNRIDMKHLQTGIDIAHMRKNRELLLHG